MRDRDISTVEINGTTYYPEDEMESMIDDEFKERETKVKEREDAFNEFNADLCVMLRDVLKMLDLVEPKDDIERVDILRLRRRMENYLA